MDSAFCSHIVTFCSPNSCKHMRRGGCPLPISLRAAAKYLDRASPCKGAGLIAEMRFHEFFRSLLPDALLLREQFHNVPALSRRVDRAFLQQSSNHRRSDGPISPLPFRRVVSSFLSSGRCLLVTLLQVHLRYQHPFRLPVPGPIPVKPGRNRHLRAGSDR